MALHRSTGILEYSNGNGYGLRVVIDPEISRYYRSLIPKYIVSNVQMYAPHISVIRKEVPPSLAAWKRHHGVEVEFEYENIVRFGSVYVWLNCFCFRLEEIRKELGLEVHSHYTLPPDGFSHCFHCTIGNFKVIG
jgi:hypothetical protein